MLDAVRAVHQNDMPGVGSTIGGMDAQDYAKATLTVMEVAVGALAVGTRSDFDGALGEVRSQMLGRLSDEQP